MKKDNCTRSGCPINVAIEFFGDKWTLLIVRDLLFSDKATFNDLLGMEEGISTGMLSDRLTRLLERGIIVRRVNKSDGRSADYYLTPKGKALEPLLVELVVWIADHEMPEIPADEVAQLRTSRSLNRPDDTAPLRADRPT